MSGGARRELFAIAVALLLLIAVAAGLWLALLRAGLDPAAFDEAAVERFVRAWGAWSAAASVALMVLHSFLPLPAEIIPIANGMLFGPLLGIALTWLGAMLGAALSFALARGLGRNFVRLVVAEARWRKLERLSLDAGSLLVIRLIPLISFNLVNYAAGLLGVPLWRFLWTTALGILPLTVAMVVAGTAMRSAPLWAWIAGTFLLLLALALLLARRRRAQQTL